MGLMSKPSYSGEEICVVGLGCVLPGGHNPDQWWNFLLKAEPAFSPMPANRLNPDLYLSSKRAQSEQSDLGSRDSTYTSAAAWIHEKVLESIRVSATFNTEHSTRFELLLYEATRQALSAIPASLLASHKTGIILGSMNQDESISQWEFLKEWEKLRSATNAFPASGSLRDDGLNILDQIRDDLIAGLPPVERSTVASSSLRLLRDLYGIQGEAWFVDAACASSLGALHAASLKLSNHELDLVVTGGIEANLSPESFALFSRLGVFAEGICAPLKKTSTGMMQGEGSAVFALMRMGDALSNNLDVHAVLRGCAGSTSVRSNALFAPDAMAQIQAVEGARIQAAGRSVSYIECHATGTSVGDQVEIEALRRAYADARSPIPVASVKSLIGHTKSTAGAAGLLKCILMLRHGVVPKAEANAHDSGDCVAELTGSNLYYANNAEGLSLNSDHSPRMIGLNSAGFGGINYHCLVEEFSKSACQISLEQKIPSTTAAKVSVALIAKEVELRDGVFDRIAISGLRIPPSSFASIDESHLQGLLAVKRIVDGLKLNSTVNRSRVAVLSASSDALPAASSLSRRVRYNEFRNKKYRKFDAAERLFNLRETLPEITEDSGPGILNNVLASRVAQTFGFSGPSLNVDSDLVCFPQSVGLAKSLLQSGQMDAVIVVSVERYLGAKPFGYISAPETYAHLFMTEKLAQELGFPLLAILGDIKTHATGTLRGHAGMVKRSSPPALLLEEKLVVGDSSYTGDETVQTWESCFGDVIGLSMSSLGVKSASPTLAIGLQSKQVLSQSKNSVAMFAGQGANFPGMFRERWGRLGVFRDYFDLADSICKAESISPVSKYVLSPDELSASDLVLLQNLALFTAQVAMYEEKKGEVKPSLLTAHSFGEFAMLVASGCIEFTSMFKFLIARETLAPTPNSLGWLVAVAASAAEVQTVLAEIASVSFLAIAIVNSPSQVVVACPVNELSRLTRALGAKGLRNKVLPTLQPYHSEALRGYATQLSTFLEHHQPAIVSPHTPFVSSVSGDLVDETSPRDIGLVVTEILRGQLCQTMDFTAQMNLIDSRVDADSWIEIGPRPVLLTFVAQTINRRVTLKSWGELYSNLPAVDVILSTRVEGDDLSGTNKIFSVVSRVVSKVTGYKLEGISVEDRMQDDLGIDSIKKAEIVFTTLGQLQKDVSPQLDLRKLKKIRDIVEYVQSMDMVPPVALLSSKNATFDLALSEWIPAKLSTDVRFAAEYFETPADLVFNLGDQETSSFLASDQFTAVTLSKMLKVGSVKSLLVILAESKVAPRASLVGLVEAFSQLAAVVPCLEESDLSSVTLVTGWPRTPAQEAVCSLAKSLAKEIPGILLKIIAVDHLLDRTDIPLLAAREVRDSINWEVRYQGENRYLRKICELKPRDLNPVSMDQKVVLVFGGAKGITHSLLCGLAASNQSMKVIVCGRTPETDLALTEAITQLRTLGLNSVHYKKCDATDSAAVHALFAQVIAEFSAIDLVINGVGIEVSRTLKSKSFDEISAEVIGKALPALNIQECAEQHQAKTIVHFTSIVSAFGNHGQTVYAGVNGFIDSYLVGRAGFTKSRTLAIAWPPWDQVGMTSSPLIHQSLLAAGLALLSPDLANKLFQRILIEGAEGIVFVSSPVDRPLYELGLRSGRKVFPHWDSCEQEGRALTWAAQWTESDWAALSDHAFEGLKYLPAAAIIMIFGGIHRLLRGDGAFEVFDFEVLQPFIVGSGEMPVSIAAVPSSASTSEYQLNFASSTLNARCRTSTSADRDVRAEASENSIKREIVTEDSLSLTGDIYGDNGLFHGPLFQSLASVSKSSGVYVGIVSALSAAALQGAIAPSVSSSRRLGLTELNRVRILDGVMQLAAFAASDLDGRKALPVGLKHGVFNTSLCDLDQGTYRVEARPLSGVSDENGEFSFNALLVASDGRVAASFFGLTVKCIDGYEASDALSQSGRDLIPNVPVRQEPRAWGWKVPDRSMNHADYFSQNIGGPLSDGV